MATANKVKVRLPDGKEIELEAPATAADVAAAIGPGLAKAARGAIIDGELIDLLTEVPDGAEIRIVTKKDSDEVLKLSRHTMAHVMAQAVEEMFAEEGHPRGEVMLGIGPVIDHGFYYDFDLPRPLKEADLAAITRRMEAIRKADLPMRKFELPRDEALKRFQDLGDPYKVDLVEGLPEGEAITFYEQGGEEGFTDLCRGPHVPSTGQTPKAFQLMSVAGAYWRGDEKNKMLQRIYAVAFDSKKELDAHLGMLEEAKRRDHRKLGKQLQLFAGDAEVGSGLPLWLPRGATIRRQLERFIIDKETRAGFQHVYTPQMAKVDLYETSGHWAHYQDSMFPPMEIDNERFVLRPMNCPHHCKVYAQGLHSYRDLPIRIAELGTMYRYEQSGELSGLSRVRAMTLNDAHIFCLPAQIKEEFIAVVEMIREVYDILGLKNYWYRLSLRDPADTEKYVQNDEMWDHAEAELAAALDEMGLDYTPAKGEAAFYGPKLDVQIPNVLGHDETVSTVQLDFHLANVFGLEYVDEESSRQTPVMIHRGVLSTMERMVAFLIENYAGDFPLWLAPEQVRVVPITDGHNDVCQALRDELIELGLRSEVDLRSERMNAKIREAEILKVPYIVIIGDKELEAGAVSFRSRREKNANGVPRQEFIDKVVELDRTRAL